MAGHFRAMAEQWAGVADSEYDPGCVLTFDPEDVEEIEGVAVEAGGDRQTCVWVI